VRKRHTTALRRGALVATLIAAAIPLLGLGTATAASTGCGTRDLSQPFTSWLDPGHYFLAPGGDVETTTGWTLTGGARVVNGNEPFFAHNGSDSHSLLLPSGASARTPGTCVDTNEPTARFFVRNTGSPLSTLAVEARIRTTVLGQTTQATIPLGVVLGTTQSWQPSLPVVFELSANQLLGSTTVDFRFAPLGANGTWQVDDVYVDPFKNR
jgi:hypothetical protein